MPPCSRWRKTARQAMYAFADAAQAEGFRLDHVRLGNAAAIVAQFERNATFFPRQLHHHQRGMGVFGDVGERFWTMRNRASDVSASGSRSSSHCTRQVMPKCWESPRPAIRWLPAGQEFPEDAGRSSRATHWRRAHGPIEQR